MKWIGLGILIFVAYCALIAWAGTGLNPLGIEWNFENSGQYGDSFGPLTALMSTMAAVSAYLAYQSQRTELHRLKSAADDERVRASIKDFEDTFFKMLTLHRDVLRSIDIKQGETVIQGADAVQCVVDILDWFVIQDKAIKERCKQAYSDNQNDLGHYLRLSYHIVKMIDEDCYIDKMKYIRIFRATLSNSEMILIGLTCAYGAGHDRFLPLVARYALLHNISAKDAKNYGLTAELPPSSFGNRTLRDDGTLSA